MWPASRLCACCGGAVACCRPCSSSQVAGYFNYARNQWPSLVRYLNDARFVIDNGAAERAIRPIAVGRANWLQVGGDSGLPTASVLLSVCASARRNRLDPWAYLTHVLKELPARPVGGELSDLLPDEWAKSRGETHRRVG